MSQAFIVTELNGDGPLIVGGPAAKESAVAFGQRPRIGDPVFTRFDRLHVVMGIQEDGGFAGGTEPFAIGIRIAVAGPQDVDVLQSSGAHHVAGQLGGLLDFLLMLAIGADARNGHQSGQIGHEILVIRHQPVQNVLHWRTSLSEKLSQREFTN